MINSRGCVFTTAIEPLDRCNVTSACKFSMVLRVVCVVGYLFFFFRGRGIAVVSILDRGGENAILWRGVNEGRKRK